MSRLNLSAALALGIAAATLQPAVSSAQQASTVGGPASLVPADLEFVLKAADDGLAEVALGKLAQIAAQVATKPPQQPSEVSKEVEKTLAAYAGQEFDEVYIAQQVGAHEVALALFEHAAEHAEAPAVREFAKKQAPVIQEHLEQAQALMKKTGEKG